MISFSHLLETFNEPCSGRRFSHPGVRHALVGLLLLVHPWTAHADFFKWEVLVFREGPRGPFETLPVTTEGTLTEVTGWGCDIGKFWTTLGSELVAEGKTLSCRKGEQVLEGPLVCTASNRDRRYNRLKEDYARPQEHRLYLKTANTDLPTLILLRCFF